MAVTRGPSSHIHVDLAQEGSSSISPQTGTGAPGQATAGPVLEMAGLLAGDWDALGYR